jgi:hypothetical protein
MKLAHIYLEEHNNLKQINIPLNGSFSCNLHDNYTLSLALNSDTSHYYNNIHCSALMGDNGAGKSSIIDFLNSSINPTDSSGIIVFYEKGSSKFHVILVNLHAEEIISNGFEYDVYDHYKSFLKSNNINIANINNMSGFESNLIYKKKSKSSLIHNLSASRFNSPKKGIGQLERMLSFSNRSRWFKNKHSHSGFIFGLQPLKLGRFLRNFKVRSKTEQDEKSEPGYVTDYDYDYFENVTIDSYPGNDVEEKEFFDWENSVQFQYIFSDSFTKICFNRNILAISSLVKERVWKDSNLSEIYTELFIKSFIQAYSDNYNVDEQIRQISYYLEENVTQTLEIYNSKKNDYFFPEKFRYEIERLLFSIKDSFDNIHFTINHLHFEYEIAHDENTIQINNISHIADIRKQLDKLPAVISRNFIFNLRGISTGELAKLYLYSEIFLFLEQELVQKNKLNIIFIDEADLYFHPEWQRIFLSEVLDLISNEFKASNVQLVISSHSPIMISDFLPRDITALKKTKHGITVVSDSYGFGSSIAELYLSGMHLESTFGQYSQEKIKDLVDRKKTNTLSKDDRVLIGEINNKHVRNFLLGDNKND